MGAANPCPERIGYILYRTPFWALLGCPIFHILLQRTPGGNSRPLRSRPLHIKATMQGYTIKTQSRETREKTREDDYPVRAAIQ